MSAVRDFLSTHVWKYLSDISFVDILDILVLSVLIFLLYRFMRDRRAGKLMIGVGAFVVLLVISSLLDMRAVKYILHNFYQVGILALVVVFQPELRAALEKVGNTPLAGIHGLRTGSREMELISKDIEAICEAACDMSRVKTGALIVIERETKLGEYIRSGVMINAQMTPFLLRNIFFNKAPLHDGAVIIRDHRIFAAGCFLPLSCREDIIKDLGTRHRSAIGLCEVSDAIVVVVSEETGIISVAYDGCLRRNYNYNSLKQELLKLMVHSNRRLKENDGAPDERK